METKILALIIVFAALAVALNPIRIPTFFWPGQYFRLWEIPIIIAALLFGLKVGFSVAILNGAAQMAFFPGPAGIIAGPWEVIAMSTMFLGVYLTDKLIARRGSENSFLWVKPVVYFTAIITATRVAIMPPVDYAIYLTILPISAGKIIPEAFVTGLVPFFVLFNVIVPLTTVPVCYLLAKTISKNLKVGKKIL